MPKPGTPLELTPVGKTQINVLRALRDRPNQSWRKGDEVIYIAPAHTQRTLLSLHRRGLVTKETMDNGKLLFTYDAAGVKKAGLLGRVDPARIAPPILNWRAPSKQSPA